MININSMDVTKEEAENALNSLLQSYEMLAGEEGDVGVLAAYMTVMNYIRND